MPIPESDISILIPTYRYRDKVTRAVESALASNAAEIIVTDDRSLDGTMESLAKYRDPRLTVIQNENNLGLWENHRKALTLTSRPWIKFIQADDYLLPGGLKKFAAVADKDVSVVSAAAILKDDLTGESWLNYDFSKPITLTWESFHRGCLHFGSLLGSPSYMLLRADAIDRHPLLWRREMSADLVLGSIAATQGSVILLPPGAIGHGAHAMQDARTQNAALGLARLSNSLAYLRNHGDQRLRRLANDWTLMHLLPASKTMAKGLFRREDSTKELLVAASRLLTTLTFEDLCRLVESFREVRLGINYRKTYRPPFNLEKFFSAL